MKITKVKSVKKVCERCNFDRWLRVSSCTFMCINCGHRETWSNISPYQLDKEQPNEKMPEVQVRHKTRKEDKRRAEDNRKTAENRSREVKSIKKAWKKV